MLKSELIANAYQQLRIWGITTSADPEDTAAALRLLDSMMAELQEQRGCNIGYNFTDTPDPNDPLGVRLENQYAVELGLAVRLIPLFNKQVPEKLLELASGAVSTMVGQAVKNNLRQVAPPSRMPRGSGARYANRYRRFNAPDISPEDVSTANKMSIGDINDYTEDFTAYLAGETIASYTITSTDGLTLSADTNDTTTVSYRAEAESNADRLETVTLVITTSTGRKLTRGIEFEVS